MAQEGEAKRKGGWWSSLVGTDAALDAARAEAEAVFKSLHSEIARLEEELALARDERSKRDERVEELDAELRHAKQQSNQQQASLAEARKQLEASEAQARKQREELEAQRRVREQREAESAATRAAIEQELARANAKIDALGLSLKESEAKVEKAVAELLELRRRAESDKAAAAARERQATESGAEASRTIASLRAEIDTGAIELAKERDRTRAALAEADKARGRVSELERAKGDLERANSLVAKSNDELSHAKSALEAMTLSLDRQLSDERARASANQTVIDGLRAELQSAKSETSAARAELATSKASVLSLEKSAAVAREESAARARERDAANAELARTAISLSEEREAHAATKAATERTLRALLGAKSGLALTLVERASKK